MKLPTIVQNHLATLLLLLVIGLQFVVLHQLSHRVSEQEISRVETRLADIQQALDTLVSQQTYITTPDGVAVNISRNDIEQAVALAVNEALPEILVDKGHSSSQMSGQTPFVEGPLSPLQEQNRFQSQQSVNQIVDNAILMGHWTRQDTQDLLPHMGNLSTAQRNEIIKKFTDAISHNRIQLDAPPPPL